MADKKKIVYIVPNFPCYSETFILNELYELNKRGYDITIFSFRRPEEKIIQKHADKFLKDTYYSTSLLNPKLLMAHFLFCVRRADIYVNILFTIVRCCLKKPSILFGNLFIFYESVYFAFRIVNMKINHIHAHFANYPATSAMVISRLLNIPFSFTCHAHDIFYDTTMLDLKIENAKVCFTISEYNRNYIAKTCPNVVKEKIKVHHCGVNPEKFCFTEKKRGLEKIRILSVGRLVPTKGFDDLIAACRILKDKNINFACKIIGEGPMKIKLKSMVQKFGLKNEIMLAGPLVLEDTIKAYGEAHIFILASKKASHKDVQDGIPVVLMEAMAAGLVVISTSISGIPELVKNDETGILVPAQDARSLVEAIMKLSSDKELSRRLARNARRKVEAEFNIKKNIDRIIDVFFD